jgi:hypothetical protein
MTRGSGRWENRDLRDTFPVPSERKSQPRYDGLYRDPGAGAIRFAPDGSLRWDGQSGGWNIHGHTLRVQAAHRDCEGAIDNTAIYLLCTEGEGREARTQLVLAFSPDA